MDTVELDKLIEALTEGNIPDEDLVTFEAEVISNPASMKYYLARMDIENLLHHHYNLNDYISKPVISMDRVLKQQQKKSWRIVTLATAALIIFGLTILALFNANNDHIILVKLGPETQYSISHKGSHQHSDDLAMRKGSRMKFEYGTVELKLKSGVRAVIKSPADIKMLENGQLKIRYGVAWFHVPSGEEGFTIHTSELRVVDLGTEFGIKAHLTQRDEVHVLSGKVRVTSLQKAKDSAEFTSNKACIVNSFGRLEEVPVHNNLFIDSLPEVSLPHIVLEEQFNNGLLNWKDLRGFATAEEGRFLNLDCTINTIGQDDHSITHFSPTGDEIPAFGNGFITLGKHNQSEPVVIAADINIVKGRRYTIYFRHAGSHNGSQKVMTTVKLKNKVLINKSFNCPNKEWASSQLSFTSEEDGTASLQFSNTGSSYSDGSDTLLDSILVVSSPLTDH